MQYAHLTALARFFRIGLSKGKTIITVRDEIEHVKNYLTIQKMRYKNKFEYYFEVEEEVLELSTLKLILQPIVENAVAYGMEFQDGMEKFYQSIFERRKVDFFKLWIMVRELCRSVWKRFARGKLSLRRKVRGSVCEMSESGSSLHMEKNMESKLSRSRTKALVLH